MRRGSTCRSKLSRPRLILARIDDGSTKFIRPVNRAAVSAGEGAVGFTNLDSVFLLSLKPNSSDRFGITSRDSNLNKAFPACISTRSGVVMEDRPGV